jgi:hypothetical protein
MSKSPLIVAALCLSLLPFAAQHQAVAKDAALKVNYSDVVAAYAANAAAARKKYDRKRLAFTGVVLRMGSEPGGTYFGAMTEDGAKFDTDWDVAAQNALAPKFQGGRIVPFQPSPTLTFACLNEGYIAGAIIPAVKLTNCQVSK